jgi:RNA recognition motif-containing protein
MPGKLFVGNISFNVADADLSELCSSLNIKTESVRIMRDMDTGRSRGFAFIELGPEVDIAAAIEQLNAKVLDGRALTVNEARPQKKREFGGGGGHGFSRKPGKFGPGGGGGRGDSRRRERDRPKRKIQELY